MPLPKPRPRESRDDFLGRCMADQQARVDFPEPDQRFAVCNTQWREKTYPDIDLVALIKQAAEGDPVASALIEEIGADLEWLRHITGLKALIDILSDAVFWERLRVIMMKRMMPVFGELFLVGAELGADQRPVPGGENESSDVLLSAVRASLGEKQDEDLPRVGGAGGPLRQLPFDFEAATAAADEMLLSYTDSWWRQFSQSTQNGLRSAIQRAQAQGLGVESVIADIEPLFGTARAENIAVTETTRLIGQGAQATYKQAGFTQWEWRSVRDARVDVICEALDGKTFSMSQSFTPAHPNCRCWPVPAGKPTALTLAI